MKTISIRLPEDVINDLKEVAPLLDYAGYQPLIRAYIGQGLRKHLAQFEDAGMLAVASNVEDLRAKPAQIQKHG
jgi:hypothetical protein